MLEGARGIASAIEEAVELELAANPDYSLVVVGHSLGGGVAAVLATLWEHKFPEIAVYAYGCPCVGTFDMEPTSHKSVVSVVGEGDPISRLSLGHIADLSSAIAYLCENESLRSAILTRSEGPVAEMDEVDLKWCFDTMEELRERMTGDKMYPPGRILYISRSNLSPASDDTIALREMPPSYFGTMRLHPRMLDMSRHVPTLYESYLQRLWSEKNGA
jgi:pimeloyl-ACP methyl ester carboxylesterase